MFHRIKEWIIEHPYLSGGLVLLIVLYFVLRGSSSGSSGGTVQGTNTQLAAANLQAQTAQTAIKAQSADQTNTLNAAIAAKQIESNTTQYVADAQKTVALAQTDNALAGLVNTNSAQLAAMNTQVGGQVQIAQVQSATALGVAGLQEQGSVQIAGLQYGAAVQIAGIGANRDITIAGIQQPVQLAAIQAALDQQRDIDKTSVDLANIDAYKGITINGQNTTAAVEINAQNTTAAVDITKLKVDGTIDLAQINAGILSQYFTDQHDIITNQQNNQKNTIDQIIAGENAGVYNKGGSGGANQISVLQTLFGGNAGNATQQTQQSNTAANDAVWTTFLKTVAGVATTVF